MAEAKQGNPLMGMVALGAIGFLVYSCFATEPPTEEELAAQRQQEAEDQRRGFHCLSGWDGSHPQFRRAVEGMMRDPDSFEHIETRVTPVSAEGSHIIVMEYRARNGFGGMNVGMASGTYQNDNCASFEILSVE